VIRHVIPSDISKFISYAGGLTCFVKTWQGFIIRGVTIIVPPAPNYRIGQYFCLIEPRSYGGARNQRFLSSNSISSWKIDKYRRFYRYTFSIPDNLNMYTFAYVIKVIGSCHIICSFTTSISTRRDSSRAIAELRIGRSRIKDFILVSSEACRRRAPSSVSKNTQTTWVLLILYSWVVR